MDQGVMLDEARPLLDRLEEQAPDALIGLIALCNADPRPDKIDVGVGVFRDSAGNTPILKCVKAAEKILQETQATKAYIGSQGDAGFVGHTEAGRRTGQEHGFTTAGSDIGAGRVQLDQPGVAGREASARRGLRAGRRFEPVRGAPGDAE